MATKIKKKVDRPREDDPNQPDQVLVATRETYDWLSEHRVPVLSGVAALTVVIIIGTLALDRWSQRNIEPTRELFEALAIEEALIGEDAEGEEGELRFDSPSSRDEALIAHFDAFLGRTSGKIRDAAKVWQAGVLLRSNRHEDAADAYRSATSSWDTVDSTPARIALAGAIAEGGDLNGALAILDELESNAPSSYQLGIASQRARLIDTFGEPTEALDAYRALLDAFPGAGIMDRVENRIGQLEIELAVASLDSE